MITPSSTELLSLLESVERGARVLDDYLPEWYDQLDLDKLDLSNVNDCVLGQLFGHGSDLQYQNDCAGLGVTTQEQAVLLGFHTHAVQSRVETYAYLTRFWAQQVRIRRALSCAQVAPTSA